MGYSRHPQVTLADMKLGATQQMIVDLILSTGHPVCVRPMRPGIHHAACRLLDKGVLSRPAALTYDLSPAYKAAKGIK